VVACRLARTATDSGRLLATAYFLFFVNFGLFVPYFPLYLSERGFGAVEIGGLLALGPLMRTGVPPLLGILADRSRGPGFWGTMAAWGAVAGLALVWLGADARLVMILGLATFFLCTAPALPLLDVQVMRHIERTRSKFGRIRLWGSAGYVLASMSFGLAFTDTPAHLIAIALVASYTAFALFLSLSRMEDVPPSRPDWSELPAMLRSPGIVTLLAALFLNRVASAPFNGYYSIFVRESGLDGRVVALTWGIAVVTEIVAMVFVDRWIDRFGYVRVLVFGVLLEAARWFAFSQLQSEPALLLLAPTHGIAFAALLISSIRGIAAIVPERFRSLGQGLVAAAAGLGQVVGYAGMGFVHDAAGNAGMFFVAGVVGLAATATALSLARRTAETRHGER
jgi:PPP family 3-phenylpropionic acid transporter